MFPFQALAKQVLIPCERLIKIPEGDTAVNTSKKQAYEAGALRGALNPGCAEKKSSPSVVEYFSSDDSEQEERPCQTRVESVRTKRPGPKAPPLEMFYFARKVVDEIHTWTIVMFQLYKPSRHVARGFYLAPHHSSPLMTLRA